MKRVFIWVLAVLGFLTLLGVGTCGVLAVVTFSQGSADVETTDAIAERYFESIREHDFNAVRPLYDERFFAESSWLEWVTILRTINTRLGDLRSYEREGWRITNYVGTDGPAKLVIVSYNTTYSLHDATETITFVFAEDEEPRILGHLITSQGLLE